MVVLPTPPFGANTEKMRVLAFSWSSSNALRTPLIRLMRSKPGERHRQDAVDAPLRIGLDGILRHGQDDDRHPEAGFVDLLDEARALHPALQERVDDHDVRSQFLDLEQGLAAFTQDVEQLDLALCVQEAADVLGDLRHVLDDQQACLVT